MITNSVINENNNFNDNQNNNSYHKRIISVISNLKDNPEIITEQNLKEIKKNNNNNEYFNENFLDQNNQKKENNEDINLDSKESDLSYYDIHTLKLQIQEQATQIVKLENYKSLCEKRILQLEPNHPLPIKEKHIKNILLNGSDIGNNEFQEQNYKQNIELEKYKKEISNLHQKLNLIKEELNSANNKNLYYEDKIKKGSLNNTNMNLNESEYSNQLNLNLKNGFPFPADKIPNEFLRENYNKLFILYNENLEEKYQILETLKIETINNEEQKNQIDILKKMFENFIMENDFALVLNDIKKKYYKDTSKNYSTFNNTKLPENIDFLVQISQQQLDLENSKEELMKSNNYNRDLKEEIEYLINKIKSYENNINNTSLNSSNAYKNTNNNQLIVGNNDFERIKDKLKLLETENQKLSKENENIRNSSKDLQEELKTLQNIIEKLKIEKESTNQKYVETISHLENSQAIQNKIFDYKKSFDKIYLELNENIQQKKILEEDFFKIKKELEYQKTENQNIKEEMKNLELEKNNYCNQLNLFEKLKLQMQNNFEIKDSEFNSLKLKYEDLLKKCENSFSNNMEFEKLHQEYDNYKNTSEKKIENLKNQLEEKIHHKLNSTNNKIAAYEKSKVDANFTNSLNFNESKESESENANLKTKIFSLEKEIFDKNQRLLLCNEKHENLLKEYNELENTYKNMADANDKSTHENLYWKNKYDNDILKKINEIRILNKNSDEMQKELIADKETIKKLKQ